MAKTHAQPAYVQQAERELVLASAALTPEMRKQHLNNASIYATYAEIIKREENPSA
jgi:hypothetical protein